MKSRLMLVVVMLGLAVGLSAQTFRGGIQGVVVDSSGASVSGAEVTVTNEGTGLTRTAQTTDAGEYAFTELPIGSYSVSASKSGFQTQTVTGATVTVSAIRKVDLTLAAGSVETKVEVTASLPLIQTGGNTMGGTIQTKEFSELPVNGRDYIKLIGLVSGVAADPSAVTDSPGSFGLFSINGNRGRSNNYLLDGTDMNDGYRNLPSINEAGVFGTPATLLPVDAVAEMGVLNTTEAEYGRNSGAIVNIVTKSGTNDFHGTAFYFGRADALDARNYFNQEPAPQSTFRNDQFGGAIGGPFIKDKTFWFFAYEGQRERVGIPTPSTIPTLDQVTCFQTLGGTIHPVTANILALNPWTQGSPLPAAGDGGPASADCVANPATPLTATLDAAGSNNLHSLIFKMDHNFNSNKDLITGRYFFGDSDQSFPLGLVGGSAVPGYNTVTPTTVHVVSLSWTHNFSDRLLMEVRGGYNRFFETFFPEDADLDPASLGLNTVSNPQDFGLPLIRFSGAVSNIGSNLSLPRGRVDTNSQVFANVSYNTGRHNWKAGYEFRRTFVNAFFDAGYRGRLTFDSFDTVTGSFLSGEPSGGGNRQARGNSDRDTFQNNHSFYVQDNFRWTRKLTVNLGLRWDYYGVIGEEKGRFSLLDTDPVSGGLVFADQLYPKDFNNFGPRVSFAYDVFGTGKTVIRGGWGLYYDAFSQDFFVGQLPFNTFNPGPAYNPVGPDAVLFNFGPANLTLVAGPCVAPNIAVPGSAMCAPPVYADADFFDSDVFTVDQNLATPYVQNYNLNVQQEIGGHAALQVGYVGSAGRRLFRYRDINQSLPNAGGARPFDAGPFAPSGGTFFYVNQFESTSASGYNALQTQFTIRNWHGFNSKVNYTWSHSIDNASDGQDYVANATQPDNSFNPSGERASSNFDSRHRFNWYFTYDLPKTDTLKWLLSGWSLDGVFSYSTGQPFHLVFFDDYNGTGEFFPRPDLVGDPFAGTSEPFNYLNLAAFQVPCTLQDQDIDGDTIVDTSDGSAAFCAPGSQHFGSLGRNALIGPSFHNFDFAISKAFQVTDRVRVNFRADFFNIFNHPNFTNPLLPDFAVDASFNGVDSVTGRGIGFLPLRATPDAGIGNPFLGGGGPRNIQLGVRVTF